MSSKVQQSVCSDCVTYAKSRIKFNTLNTFNNVINHYCRLYTHVDGINFSPKSKYDYAVIKKMLTNGDFAIEFFAHARSNRIILMPNDFMTREEQEKFIDSLHLKGLAFYGAKFEVEYREWQEEFKPNGGVWRRLPVFL